jgi:nitrogen fixation protein FixH
MTGATRAPRASFWPKAIVGLIALHITFMVVVIVVATRDPSFAVEPNHYQKALAWDRLAARQRQSAALGWQVTVESEPRLGGDGRRDINCRVVDRDGAPVTGASVRALAFAHARGEDRVRLEFGEGPAGGYQARAPLARAGLWELRFEIRHGADIFVTTILHEVRGQGT